ncbi:hypothetical protein NPIL_78571 [Nephila pilipes]|uniref:Uncharacterized protein n=1 Tax=Nephila pilipes TaxID=299642 RepID=A0A8X6Q9X8_NEPPI|nr:hypothetical protein NPIL_78571 [Nephila pilipes]
MLCAKPPIRRCHKPAVLSVKPRMSVSARQKGACARLPGPYPSLYPRRRIPGIRFRRPVRRGTPLLSPPLHVRLGLVEMAGRTVLHSM